MTALRVLVVFLAVFVLVTAAAVTALFLFWGMQTTQPGTATALGLLFVGAPLLGLVAGLSAATRTARPQSRGRTTAGTAMRGLRVALAGLVGALAGYGGARAAIDLTYTDRWADPASAPSWLPVAPTLAGVGLALVLALAAALRGRD